MKKSILFVAAVCMALPLTSVHAADTNVDVKYDFSNSVDPTDPDFQVSIPAGVVFDSADPSKYVQVSVELLPAQGYTEITTNATADISVKSSNQYKVQLEDTTDPVSYSMKYGTLTLSGANAQKIGTLSKDSKKIEGTAVLNGVATKTGAHTDTLTFTVTKNK